MWQDMLRKFFGSQGERELKRISPIVERINAFESDLLKLSDADLRNKTIVFRDRLEKGETLDALLPEAFAVVREGAKRVLGQRHYDVQMIGGIVLHEGKIAEMKTGEGKTLVATLPSYLNALTGKGVHVVTVNDYLARRDAEWMGSLHRFLGLSVGVIVHGLTDEERKVAYAADVTYGTNNEFGFDYLRDNMKFSLERLCQRDLYYAIVDEVDSILIDEARTPLIISGPSEDDTGKYAIANRVIPQLKQGTKGEHQKGIEETGDYWADEKAHSATLTEQGVHRVERILGVPNLYDPNMLPLLHAVNQALLAHALKRRDVDYIVKSGESGEKEVIIVDEHTGRLMPGRRWSDGLHQAVEAKEGITVQSENQTLATITFQNYFRMYDKLSGMTGTADTEAQEFAKIYDLDVVVIPTNRPMVRKDHPDVVFKSKREKFNAVLEEIRKAHQRGQPVLVGTISIETSEDLSNKLSKFGVTHNVLNAKAHEREAEIVSQAGRRGAVTISTNMAGRGTDIVLGGNAEMMALAKCPGGKSDPNYASLFAKFEAQCARERKEVLDLGGLYIVGTERHESRRIDNQLRGRAGRQGDPGASRFFLSLEDDLMRIFGSQRIVPIMERLGLEEGEAIEHRMISRAIERAQEKVEARNFESREYILKYDDVMNKQRTSFYSRRRAVLKGASLHEDFLEMVDVCVASILDAHWPAKGEPSAEVLVELAKAFTAQFGVAFHPAQPPFSGDRSLLEDRDRLGGAVLDHLLEFLRAKEKHWNDIAEKYAIVRMPNFAQLEREVYLRALDRQWKEHLLLMDGLKENISLRGYAQKDPQIEYQREGFQLFEQMLERIDFQTTSEVFRVTIQESALEAAAVEMRAALARAQADQAAEAAKLVPRAPGSILPRDTEVRGTETRSLERGVAASAATVQAEKRAGRNDPCPCGSGKKYKKCHGS